MARVLIRAVSDLGDGYIIFLLVSIFLVDRWVNLVVPSLGFCVIFLLAGVTMVLEVEGLSWPECFNRVVVLISVFLLVESFLGVARLKLLGGLGLVKAGIFLVDGVLFGVFLLA